MSKEFQLLKELLLQRECGAYDSLDKSIDLAIDIYCKSASLERAGFIEELKDIYNIVWDGFWSDLKSWERRQYQYEKLIDLL